MKKVELIILSLIILGGFLVRLYHFSYPISDWHSWRQVDTSSVSRIFVQEGINLLYPKFHDLSNVPSGIYFNPEGYRFVEFPIYNLFQAGAFIAFGKFTLEEWGRLVTIFSSLFSAIFIFHILRRHLSSLAGFLGAFFYSFLPFSVFWGRTVLPDQTAIMATLGAIYFFDLYLEASSKNQRKFLLFIVSFLFFSSALLLKPFTVFFFAPALYLAYKKYGFGFLKKKDLWTMAIFSVLPFVGWRLWMLMFPEGIPQAGWLLNGSGIRFKGSYFHWIFAKRIGEQMLGFWGIGILVLGIIAKYKDSLFFLSFLISALLYILVVATGNVHHNYYQILIVPTICIFLAIGAHMMLNGRKEVISKNLSIIILFLSTAFMFAFSWYEVRSLYNVNFSLVEAGKAVDRLTPKDAKIVAPNEGDTTLLYYTKRKGWASFSKPIEGLKKDGATHLILFNPGAQGVKSEFKAIYETKDFIIFDLAKKP